MSDSKLRKLWSQVEVFRELDPEFPSQLIAAFLFIALNPGTRVGALAPALGMSPSAVSRHVARFASVTTKSGVRGWGFIDYRDDPEDDRRAKVLYLTPKGEAFLEKLLRVS